jgi:hypothetical protein
MRLVVSLLTAVCFIAAAEASATWRCYARPEAQHHRPDQAPVACGREARWRHVPNPVPVDRRSAILQHLLLLIFTTLTSPLGLVPLGGAFLI